MNAELLSAIRKSPKIQIRLKNSKQNIALTIGVNNEYSTQLPHLRSNISPIRFETKYCSVTCRNKALYANRKHQLAKVQQLSSMAEQLVCGQERVKDLETQIKDLKQLKQENAVLRAPIQQLTAHQRYHSII